jgi:hypothetical protein
LTSPGETAALGLAATPRGRELVPDYDYDVHGPDKAKCHVIVTLVAQAGFSPDDNWSCIGMGCMRDQRRTRYTQARATKYPGGTTPSS